MTLLLNPDHVSVVEEMRSSSEICFHMANGPSEGSSTEVFRIIYLNVGDKLVSILSTIYDSSFLQYSSK